MWMKSVRCMCLISCSERIEVISFGLQRTCRLKLMCAIIVPAPWTILSWDCPASKDGCWWSQHSANQRGAERGRYPRLFGKMLIECELWVIASITIRKMPGVYMMMVLDDVLEAQCFDPSLLLRGKQCMDKLLSFAQVFPQTTDI